MNELIKQFVKIANIRYQQIGHKYSNTFYLVHENELEKFAELIVRECNECVRDVLRDENSSLGYAAAGELQHYIKQHFGIEE